MLSGSFPRWLLGLLVGVASVLLIAVAFGFIHDRLSLATPALLLVLPVLLAAVLGFVVMSVDDDGPGLGKADHARIFEPWNE